MLPMQAAAMFDDEVLYCRNFGEAPRTLTISSETERLHVLLNPENSDGEDCRELFSLRVGNASYSDMDVRTS